VENVGVLHFGGMRPSNGSHVALPQHPLSSSSHAGVADAWHMVINGRGGSRKNIWGAWLAPHHLGGNDG